MKADGSARTVPSPRELALRLARDKLHPPTPAPTLEAGGRRFEPVTAHDIGPDETVLRPGIDKKSSLHALRFAGRSVDDAFAADSFIEPEGLDHASALGKVADHADRRRG